jgi:hypothetical protein
MMEASIPRRTLGRFTIGNLMIAIAIVAGMLALPAVWRWIVIVLAIPFLSWVGACWLVSRGLRRLARSGFWGVAVLTNILAVFFCIAPRPSSYAITTLGLVVDAIPTIAALGWAWVRLSTRDDAVARQAREAAGLSVFLLAMLPILTLWTLWPLHVAFLAVRPRMERLADRVAAGKAVRFPRRVGVFWVVDSSVEPVSHYPGLLIQANRYGGPGFVRVYPGDTPNTHGTILGRTFDVYLGGGWWYRG